FHWQTQSTTTPESATGQRYINHKRNGTNVMLFVRDEKKDSFGLTPGFKYYAAAGVAGYYT
ncbi:MAG: DUF3427 domain-containing protein, partial [Clostridia bacterium]|nr:DUF3427 domain-containing protein [Clostridia bacterium]